MSRLRTFIAFDPGADVREQVASVQSRLQRSVSDLKWVEQENIHLTLLFLGEVDSREVINVHRAVEAVTRTHAPFTASFEGVGCFPNMRRPRILWAGVAKGATELTALHDELEEPLLELGCYRREDRRYTPHLTLGRCKDGEESATLAKELPKYATWSAGETEVKELLVMSSELLPRGPIYTVLSRAKLGERT